MSGPRRFNDRRESELFEKLVRLNRIAKVVKGGRRFSFSALVVVGDRQGRVGYGFGKANYVADAIKKSTERARRNMITVPRRATTLPHTVNGVFKGAKVLLKPAAPGTGIIAGTPVRAVMEAAGVSDVLTKSLGSQNAMNIVKAAFEGIAGLMDAGTVARRRGKPIREFWG
jgi:small subunit ribosomal protein S5